MRTDHLSYARLFKAALVGALLGLVFDLAVTFLTGPTRGFSVSQIPSSLAFLIVGFAGGWLFELFKAQSEVTDASVRTLADVQDNVARLTRRMTYQDRALTMLLDVPRHNEVLTELIKASFRNAFPGRDVPRDSALYDRQLLIAYDESRQLLKFDVLEDGNDMGRLFDDLQYINSRHAPALRQVQPPVTVTDSRAALRPPS
jgi:hypothetical protein